MWTKPVHKDPAFKILMKAPICFQGARETRKSTVQSNAKAFALSTPTSTFFLFMIRLENSVFCKEQKYSSRQAPRGMAVVPEENQQPQIWVMLGSFNEGDMSCHAGNTPLGRQQHRAGSCSSALPDPSALTPLPAPHAHSARSTGETLPKCSISFFWHCQMSLQVHPDPCLEAVVLSSLQYFLQCLQTGRN